jgi:muramoyltetrapeptide carboxypeptidase
MLRKPPPLRPGDPVAVVAPASAPRDPDRYAQGLDQLREAYDVRTAYTPTAPRGYLAAPDAERAETLNAAIADPEIRALFCARGGYGGLRILPALDLDAAARHPTLLVGYSDVTVLQWALYHRAGWTSISGPVVTEWAVADDAMRDAFRRLAAGELIPLTGPEGQSLRPMRPGQATGPLLAGNLSVLTRLLGTPYAPDLTGAILAIEDVDEAPYCIDRMLAHLDLAGVLDRLAGVVVGTLSPDPNHDAPTLSMDTVLEDYFGDRSYPVATNLWYGHCLPRLSLPIGSTVRLQVTDDTAALTMTEPVVDA